MTIRQYLWQTVRHHWRSNLAIVIGVIAGTAVLTGALIVGDSVRESLRALTLTRLGPVDEALQGARFFREDLATELSAQESVRDEFPTIVPAITLSATIEFQTTGVAVQRRRAGKVQLVALETKGWNLLAPERSPLSGTDLIINSRLAAQLGAQAGEMITIQIELPSDIPRESLLGKKDGNGIEWIGTIQEVLKDSDPLSHFGLVPDQQLPLTVFVHLGEVQDRLGLASTRPSPRDPIARPARVNTLLASRTSSGGDQALARSTIPNSDSEKSVLNQALASAIHPGDLNLRVVEVPKPGYLAVESDRMILDAHVKMAVDKAAQAVGSPATSDVLVYIANEIRKVEPGTNADSTMPGESKPRDAKDKQPTPAFSRYSVVAGIDPNLFGGMQPGPFGPYQISARQPNREPLLAESSDTSGVIINDWLASDLNVQVGDEIEMTWHRVGSHGELPEDSARFRIEAILTLEGTQASDRGLVPGVPGITNVKSFDEWEAPFPMKKVTTRDDEYWKLYRATPKAFIPLSSAQSLWKNRFGDLTSIRVAPVGELATFKTRFTQAFQKELRPDALGLLFQPVKEIGLAAASGTTDFGGLFVGFSFFLIVSAAILIGLLFRLGIETRAHSVGLLLAVGWSPALIRRTLISEGMILVCCGVVVGAMAGTAYAHGMVYGLTHWWVGAIGTRFLQVSILPTTLVIGRLSSAIVALIAIAWSLRGLLSISPRELLSGQTRMAESPEIRLLRIRKALRNGRIAAIVSISLTAAVVLRLIPNQEAFGGFSWGVIVYFLVGPALLAAGIWSLASWIDSDRRRAVQGGRILGLIRLGIRNSARQRSRSLLSVTLVATATFLIVAIAAGHRNPAREFPDRDSGNGGFTLMAESSVAVLHDLNTPEGRAKLGLDDADALAAWASIRDVVPFRLNPGENASCLNIYRTTQPTILGATSRMIDRGGFKFADTRSAEPWKLLNESLPDGEIPVLGDLNTLQYSLHVGIGSTLEIRGEDQTRKRIRIVGMFDSSLFQGVLVMSEAHFQDLFPSRAGYNFFLVDVVRQAPSSKSDSSLNSDANNLMSAETQVSTLLESRLPGFDVERVADRLASFLAVQNTYLSTFQTLGGFGLLLGTVGLGIVMLRNVLERRAELALLQAVGFCRRSITGLVLTESCLLLGFGIILGGTSALLAMTPHLLSTGADVPWGSVGLLLGGVFVIGMLTSLVAARAAVQSPIVSALRSES